MHFFYPCKFCSSVIYGLDVHTCSYVGYLYVRMLFYCIVYEQIHTQIMIKKEDKVLLQEQSFHASVRAQDVSGLTRFNFPCHLRQIRDYMDTCCLKPFKIKYSRNVAQCRAKSQNKESRGFNVGHSVHATLLFL